MRVIHTYHDGSVLGVMSSRRLVRLPIWKGQRIMDAGRVSEMKCAIGTRVQCLDSGYHVVKYNEDTADGRLIESVYLITKELNDSTKVQNYVGATRAMNSLRIHTLMQGKLSVLPTTDLFLRKLNRKVCELLSTGQYATIFWHFTVGRQRRFHRQNSHGLWGDYERH